MCLILVKPPEGRVYRRELRAAFTYNSDGGGLMFAHDGQIYVHKGYFGFKKFYRTFRRYEREFPESTFILHMRIGTSGRKDATMCHPFQVNADVHMAHNGILSSLGNIDRSDTMELIDKYLSKLPIDFLQNKEIMDIIDSYARSEFSKFVFLHRDGTIAIANESAGHYKEGVWYSNNSYESFTGFKKGGGSVFVGDMAYTPPRKKEYSKSRYLSEYCSLCNCGCHKPWLIEIGSRLVCESCIKVVTDFMQVECTTCNMLTGLYGQRPEDWSCEFCGSLLKDEWILKDLESSIDMFVQS